MVSRAISKNSTVGILVVRGMDPQIFCAIKMHLLLYHVLHQLYTSSFRFVTEALLLEDQRLCPNQAETGAEDLLLGEGVFNPLIFKSINLN